MIDKKINFWPLLWIAGFYGLQLLSRIYFQTLHLYGDDLELRHYAHTLALAYPPRLPLYNWLLYVSCKAFSSEVLAYYLVRYTLSTFFVFFVYQCAWFVSGRRLFSWVAVVSLGLSTNFFLNNFTHTNAALMACSLLLCLFLYWQDKEISQQKRWVTISFTLAFSLALLSKYTSWLFIITFLMAAMHSLRENNKPLLKGIVQSFLMSVVVISPYLYWLSAHLDKVLYKHKVVVKSTFSIGNALSFPGSMFVVLGLFFVIYALSYRSLFKNILSSRRKLKVKVPYKFFSAFLSVYLFLMSLLMISGHFRIRRYYQLPFLFVVELFLLYLIKDFATNKQHRRFILSSMIVIVVTSLVVIYQNPSPLALGFINKLHF